MLIPKYGLYQTLVELNTTWHKSKCSLVEALTCWTCLYACHFNRLNMHKNWIFLACHLCNWNHVCCKIIQTLSCIFQVRALPFIGRFLNGAYTFLVLMGSRNLFLILFENHTLVKNHIQLPHDTNYLRSFTDISLGLPRRLDIHE